jgi:hypothetical protein
MIRTTSLYALVGLGLAGLTAPAVAGGTCERCFRREVTPATYTTVHENVVVRPARTVRHVIPAEVGVVHQHVRVRPAHTVARHVPAQVGVVHERVQVAPARRVQTRSHDAHGNLVVCEKTLAAQYGTVARHVVVAPARVEHVHVPAEYATVARRVVTRPAQVVHHTIPAEVHQVPRTVQVAPASERWVPHHRHHGFHPHQPPHGRGHSGW